MLSPEVFLAILAILLALSFDFTNGFHNSANQVATVIKTNAMRPMTALGIAALFDFIGAFFLGTAVAQTLGKGIVDPAMLDGGTSSLVVIISALCGAIVWNLFTWKFGIPSSSSHALIGGLIGAFVAGWGFGPVNWHKVALIFAALLVSPVIGFVIAWLSSKFIFWMCWRFSLPAGMNIIFKRAQYATLIAQSLAHGTNDAQKTMGVIVFVLIIAGFHNPSGDMIIPTWVVITCSSVLALGIFCGGWRIIKKMASIYPFRPVHSFAAQFSSAGIIYTASFFGLLISTTQVISSSNMGSGTAEHVRLVRWSFVEEMMEAWMATIPASATVSAMFLFAFKGQLLFALGTAGLAVAGYFTMQWIKRFIGGHSPVDFQKRLAEQAGAVLDGLGLARNYCEEPTWENAIIVDDGEKRADEVHRALIKSLRGVYVTGPFDRHDIENLSQRLDDILDEVKKAVIRMAKFGVVPDDSIKEMLGKLIEAVEFLKKAIESLTSDPKECRLFIDSARKRENAVQHVFENWYNESNPKTEDLGDADINKMREIVSRIIKCRDEEKVQVAFMKSADWAVLAADEIDRIFTKIS